MLTHAPKLKPGNVSSKKNHISTKGMFLYVRSAIWKQHKKNRQQPIRSCSKALVSWPENPGMGTGS